MHNAHVRQIPQFASIEPGAPENPMELDGAPA